MRSAHPLLQIFTFFAANTFLFSLPIIDCIFIDEDASKVTSYHNTRRGSKLLRQEKLGSDAKYSGHFEIHDLTSGKGTLYVSHDYSNLQRTCIEEDVRDKHWYKYSETPFTAELSFAVAIIQWTNGPVPMSFIQRSHCT